MRYYNISIKNGTKTRHSNDNNNCNHHSRSLELHRLIPLAYVITKPAAAETTLSKIKIIYIEGKHCTAILTLVYFFSLLIFAPHFRVVCVQRSIYLSVV
jgi:hypothetical protein